MSQRDVFPDVLAFLFPSDKGKKAVAFLHAYIDESGRSSSHQEIVVGGYIASADRWLGFHDEWNRVLSDHKVFKPDGSLGCFHMTDFEEKRGLFTGWSEPRKHDLLQALFNVINDPSHRPWAFVFAVSVEWFKSREWSERHDPLPDAYHWAAQGVMESALRMTRMPEAPDLHGAEGMAFMFAVQKEFGATEQVGTTPGMANRLLSSLAKNLSVDGVVTVAFGTMETYAHLQAADIVAFEARKKLARPDTLRWPLRQIANSARAVFAVQPEELDDRMKAGLISKSEYIPYSDRVVKVKKQDREGR